jgi:hypothetical protein
MKEGYLPKIAIALLVLSVGVFFLSGQEGQVSAYTYTPQGCYGYNYSYYYWYYGYYPYYYYGYPYSSSSCYGYYGYYYYGYDYYSTPSKYQLTVTTDPSDLGTATGSGTFTQGTSASFSVTKSIIQTSSNTRYVFSHWSGDYSGVGTSGSITVNAASKVVAVYQLQYHLDVSSQPQSAPYPQGEGWYNAGDTMLLTVPGQILGGQDGNRLVFQGWNVDGQNLQAGVSLTVKMDGPHVAVAQYKQQYYLKVLTDQGVAYGEGWYDAGNTAQVYVSTPVSTAYGVSIVFNGWQGAIQTGSQSATVLVDGPKTVIATWRSDPTILNLTIILAVVAAVLVVAGILVYVTMGRRNHGKPVPPQYQQPALKPVQTPPAVPSSEPLTKKSAPLKKKETPESQ